MFCKRYMPFSGVLVHGSAGRRRWAGPPSTGAGSRCKGRCGSGLVPINGRKCARHSKSMVQRTSSSGKFTLISFFILHSRSRQAPAAVVLALRCPAAEPHENDLHEPIRRRCPPFLLLVRPGANAVPAIALTRQDCASVTQAIRFHLPTPQSWQHATIFLQLRC